MNNWLLWARYALLNIVGFAFLALLQINGYIQQIVNGDQSHISEVIFLLFLVGLVICGGHVLRISRQLNHLKAGNLYKLKEYSYLLEHKNEESAREALEIKMLAKIRWVELIASALVSLGLIGTVYGAIVFMLGVDFSAVSDPSKIGQLFTVMFNGMGIALYTTLVGAVLNLWLRFNYAVVEHGAAHLLAELIAQTNK